MVWSKERFLSGRIRFACPVLEFFHSYKKLLEDIWKQPEFFYTFFAPLRHSYSPSSQVFTKPKLKEIECVTALALIWPEWWDRFHFLLGQLTGKLYMHLRNIVLILYFFLPIVSAIPLLFVLRWRT